MELVLVCDCDEQVRKQWECEDGDATTAQLYRKVGNGDVDLGRPEKGSSLP
jgi:hypothetical protein